MSESKNKQLAKNSMMLYFRMLFSMFVGLYTSRVILNTLGVDDYGINNVVGGIISMFSFISWTMSASTSRYLTFELGTGNSAKLNKIFSLSVLIYIFLIILILILAETVGLWFVYNKLRIPALRLNAAVWVYQCTVVSTLFVILSIPYSALIIAHEKMTAYAFISILDTLLKLIIVYLLVVIPFDKLKVYATLFLISQIIIQGIYISYCRKKFEEVKVRFIWDKLLFVEMSKFASWSLIGNLSGVSYSQGVNILLNIFFSPAVNAARGIAVQVQSVIFKFSSNIQTAINPQITKSYSSSDLERMHQLIYLSSRYSFYLLFILSFPIMVEAKFVLTLWLNIVPDYTINFIRIILIISILDALANPLIVGVYASGKIKIYEIVVGATLLLTLPISFFVLKLGAKPSSVFIVQLIVMLISHYLRLIFAKKQIKLSLKTYFDKVIIRIGSVVLISILFPFFLKYYLFPNMISSIIIIISCILCVLLAIYIVGIEEDERNFIKNKFQLLCKKNIN